MLDKGGKKENSLVISERLGYIKYNAISVEKSEKIAKKSLFTGRTVKMRGRKA